MVVVVAPGAPAAAVAGPGCPVVGAGRGGGGGGGSHGRGPPWRSDTAAGCAGLRALAPLHPPVIAASQGTAFPFSLVAAADSEPDGGGTSLPPARGAAGEGRTRRPSRQAEGCRRCGAGGLPPRGRDQRHLLLHTLPHRWKRHPGPSQRREAGGLRVLPGKDHQAALGLSAPGSPQGTGPVAGVDTAGAGGQEGCAGTVTSQHISGARAVLGSGEGAGPLEVASLDGLCPGSAGGGQTWAGWKPKLAFPSFPRSDTVGETQSALCHATNN